MALIGDLILNLVMELRPSKLVMGELNIDIRFPNKFQHKQKEQKYNFGKVKTYQDLSFKKNEMLKFGDMAV